MTRFAFAAVFGLALGTLGGSCPPAPTDPDPVPPLPDERSACERACDRLAELGCDGWRGSPDGTSCDEVCERDEASGVARFCPNDVAAIRTCAELDAAYAACD